MLPKPDACRGCPLYQAGCGFVPDELREGAEVMVLGQNPGADEEAQGRPFVGKTGQAMEKTFLPLAGLTRRDISIGNAIRCRWQGGNTLPDLSKAEMRDALNHCRRAHLRIPSGTKLIVAQGAYALWTLTGEGTTKDNHISDWRGWLLPLRNGLHRRRGLDELESRDIYMPGRADVPVLATLHLASLYHAPAMRGPTRMDWAKVPRILAGEWPEPLGNYFKEPPAVWPREAAFDTEFTYPEGTLLRYSLFAPDGRLWVVEAEDVSRTCVVPREARVVMHNAEADMLFLRDILGEEPRIEDTMLAHATLWAGVPHDLGFLASLYGRLNRHKHLSVVNPVVYSGADAVVTMDVWEALVGEMDRDPQSQWIYEHCMRPLVPIILQATSEGLRLHQGRLQGATEALRDIARREQLKAEAIVGWPLQLSSPAQVAHQLYQVEKIKMKRERRT